MALCVATAHPNLVAATRYRAVCTAARCYRRQNAVVRCCRARVARGSAAPPHSLLHGGGLLPRVSTRRCGAAAELSTRQHGAAAQSWRQHGPAVVLTRQRGPAAIGKGGFPVAPCHTKYLRQCACEDPARVGDRRIPEPCGACREVLSTQTWKWGRLPAPVPQAQRHSAGWFSDISRLVQRHQQLRLMLWQLNVRNSSSATHRPATSKACGFPAV